MDNETKTRFKLRCVLLELLKSDYQVTDDTILEKLISHLSVKDEGYKIIDVPLCTAWARSVVSSWHDGKSSAVVVSFALRLLAIIVENENNFRDMQKSDGLAEPGSECIVNTNHGGVFLQLLREVCLTTSKSVSNFSVKCALIKLLSSLLKHVCGRQWIMSSGLWKEVHEMCLSDSSVYVVREARKFLSDLLNGMTQSQDSELESVLVNILEPFLSIPSFSDPALSTSRVIASLHLVSEVLDNALLTSDPETNKISSPVFNIICKPSFDFLSKSLEALKVTKSEDMEELLSKIAVAFYILNTVKDGEKHAPHEVKAICIQILGVFNVLINKGSVENVLKLCVLCHNYWTYVAKIQRANEVECPPAKGDEKHYRFEDQLLCLQLTPLCVGCTMGDSTLESYFQIQVSQRLEIHVMRSIYAYRDTLIKTQNSALMDRTALQSVVTISSLSIRGVHPEPEVERVRRNLYHPLLQFNTVTAYSLLTKF